jgi:hypothetical protein
MTSLAGKVAFITGAARGQGPRGRRSGWLLTAANIIAVDICDQIRLGALSRWPARDDLAATVKLVEDTGARIVAREADCSRSGVAGLPPP